MNLVVDAGNTHIKAGLFEENELIYFLETFELDEILKYISNYKIENTLLCSVITISDEWLTELKKKSNLFILDYKLPIPINNFYKTPDTLGMDRLAGVIGANFLFPEMDSLVIDIGTCLKFDLVDKNKNYSGGSISPGLHMRFQSLHHFTSKLPLLEPSLGKIHLIGNTTQQAIQSGVINGMIAEIDGTINRYKEKIPDIQLILCGGNALFFETKINQTIFAVPKLVLIGLNSILQHNVSKT